MNPRIKNEIQNLKSGIIATVICGFLLGVLRIFDSKTFLFLQILACCLFTYIALSIFFRRRPSLIGRELVAVLIAFTIVGFLTLNIDRSRSFFLLKWVSQYESSSGVTVEEIAKAKNLSGLDVQALQQRVGEQKQSIMLSANGEKVRLTVFGRLFVKTCAFLAHIFNLQGYLST